MMARRSARFRGFIQDFDYSFSWRQFLRKRGMEISLPAWEKYCEETGVVPLQPELGARFHEAVEAQMKEAAKNLEFEEAAKYRDRIKHLRDKLLGH